MEKIKILLVCSFSNQTVRENIHLRKLTLYNFIRRLFGLSAASTGYGDFAPWDSYMVDGLKQRPDVDLYVVNAHPGMKRSIEFFNFDNVHYWCLKIEVATMLKHIIKSPYLWHRFNPLRSKVKRIVKSIKPDIIALVGAENPHISGTILGIDGYPVIVKCQTIYNNPERGKHGFFDKKNAYVEEMILRSKYYFSVNTKMHNALFRQYNPSAYNLYWGFGQLYPDVKPVDKKYDFINFAAGMSDRKGFHDSIRALAIVKKSYPKVSLNLTGRYSEEMKSELSSLAADCGVIENISFTQFFEKQSDLFHHIVEAKTAVLPCKLDYISGTITQCMHYGIPVICYATEGTVTLNNDTQRVLIAEHCNVDDLAQKMLLLIDNETLSNSLKANAKQYSANKKNDKITDNLVAAFRAVIENYNTGKDIPKDLLYNE